MYTTRVWIRSRAHVCMDYYCHDKCVVHKGYRFIIITHGDLRTQTVTSFSRLAFSRFSSSSLSRCSRASHSSRIRRCGGYKHTIGYEHQVKRWPSLELMSTGFIWTGDTNRRVYFTVTIHMHASTSLFLLKEENIWKRGWKQHIFCS